MGEARHGAAYVVDHGMELLQKAAPLLECQQCRGVTTKAIRFRKGVQVCLLCLREAVRAIEDAIWPPPPENC